jgi:Rrf2 family protein
MVKLSTTFLVLFNIMLKLSKKTEYALMAVKYIALRNNGNCISAKEIAENYSIPFELLAKILQKLSKHEIIKSSQGVKGGYSLSKSPDYINLIEIINAVEPNYRLTDCMKENSSEIDCSHYNCCQIKDPLAKIHNEIDKIFRNTTLREIF